MANFLSVEIRVLKLPPAKFLHHVANGAFNPGSAK